MTSRRSVPWYVWLIAVVLVLFVASAIAAAFVGPADASHISAYLATLGGLLGAVLTAAGLVVALAAVLTLLTVQDKAAAVFQDQFERIRPELERLSDDRVEAHLLLRDGIQIVESSFLSPSGPQGLEPAPDFGRWKAGEELIRKALELHPRLPRARRLLGLTLASKVSALVRTGALSGYGWVRLEGAQQQAIAEGALEWLKAAAASDEDPGGPVALNLALMHGVTGNYGEMLEQIQHSVHGASRLTLQQPESLMLLTRAVDQQLDQEDALVRLNQLLRRPPHVTLAAFSRSIGSAPAEGIRWLAIARAEYWQSRGDGPLSPLLLLLWSRIDGTEQLARAAWFPWPYKGSGRSEIPAEEGKYVPVEELFSELNARFILVGPSEPIRGVGL